MRSACAPFDGPDDGDCKAHGLQTETGRIPRIREILSGSTLGRDLEKRQKCGNSYKGLVLMGL